jgi:hypothetical protein
LLKLFGTSPSQKPEKNQGDLAGEWERLKVKRKEQELRPTFAPEELWRENC